MLKGILFALCACFIWGLIFIVPQFMNSFTPIEIAVGRYLVYGCLSLVILFKINGLRIPDYTPAMWLTAFSLSFFASVGYYVFVVLSLRYASPAICALILGLAPITIAVYGSWKEHERNYKRLVIPSLLILVGLGLVNFPHLAYNDTISHHLLGITYALLALASWSIYVVLNSRFVKKHPKLPSSEWSTLIGVATLAWACILILGTLLFFKNELSIEKYTVPSFELWQFFIGCCVLGFGCSWVGGFLWNKASYHLPVSLAGQISIFETIFGLVFVYCLEKRPPNFLEGAGILLFLIASVLAVMSCSTSKTDASSTNVQHQ